MRRDSKSPPLCAAYREWLIESLVSDAPADARGIGAHASTCAACAATAHDLRRSWEGLGELPAIPAPAAVQERTRRAVLDRMADERHGRRAVVRDASLVPLAVASGLLAVVAVLALLGGLIWGSHLPEGHLFFCAAIFAGLLVGAFSWIYSATTVHGVHLDAAARVGVLALAITVAATTACPEFHVLAWWDRSGAGRWLIAHLGAGASSLVFGFGYGLFPGFLAALFGGKLLDERPLANGLVAAGVVFSLAIPVIYLQSAPFTWGVIAIWLAGTAIGTLCGVFGALRVRERVGPLHAVAS